MFRRSEMTNPQNPISYHFNKHGELEKHTHISPYTWTIELATEDEMLSIDPDTGEVWADD
jgi:hypothetical protein